MLRHIVTITADISKYPKNVFNVVILIVCVVPENDTVRHGAIYIYLPNLTFLNQTVISTACVQPLCFLLTLNMSILTSIYVDVLENGASETSLAVREGVASKMALAARPRLIIDYLQKFRSEMSR